MKPRHYLRIEGLVVFGLSLAAYLSLAGPLWLLAVLAFAPDLSMLGYLAGARIGARIYNLFHTYAIALALGAFGLWSGAELALLVALVWTGHIGADRAVGYGLKFESGFKQTHLSTQPAPVEALSTDD